MKRQVNYYLRGDVLGVTQGEFPACEDCLEPYNQKCP